MTYQETLDFLFSQLPMYQRIGKAAYKADLETTLKLDAAFDNPHKTYKKVKKAKTIEAYHEAVYGVLQDEQELES